MNRMFLLSHKGFAGLSSKKKTVSTCQSNTSDTKPCRRQMRNFALRELWEEYHFTSQVCLEKDRPSFQIYQKSLDLESESSDSICISCTTNRPWVKWTAAMTHEASPERPPTNCTGQAATHFTQTVPGITLQSVEQTWPFCHG